MKLHAARARGRSCARGCRAGFSLIELVMTVVIIGIIAMIAVPRVSSAAQNAKLSSVEASARVMRQALDYYSVEHEGRTPSHAADWSVGLNEKLFMLRLCRRTDSSGEPGESYGPYLRDLPVNPYNGKSTVRIAVGVPPGSGTFGWWYNPERDIFLPDDSTGTAKYILQHLYGLDGGGSITVGAPADLAADAIDNIAGPSGRDGDLRVKVK